MGNISGQDELVTKQELAAFYQPILPYLSNGSSSGGGTTYTAGDGIDIINDIISTKKSTSNDMDEIIDTLPTGSSITTVSGYTPLGTIISYYGETAPRFYLACDGSEYNKSDYPELANHLLSLTNHSQYEVDGDNTKFKVPDLRGEFLRGTGTNNHANQGSGANVGEHQDGTRFPNIGNYNNATVFISVGPSNEEISLTADSKITYFSSGARRYKDVGITTDNNTNPFLYTSRPTNTSVLYCIAYKDIYTNPMNDYSTDEKIVGTWIDGKPLYQKTATYTITSSLSATRISMPIELPNLDRAVKVEGTLDNISLPIGTYSSSAGIISFGAVTSSSVELRVGGTQVIVSGFVIFTIQYTKTTD